jgi:hypothetical protein
MTGGFLIKVIVVCFGKIKRLLISLSVKQHPNSKKIEDKENEKK